MKCKNLSKEQLITSIDRLTRFKPTKEKYFRVFSDIILSSLIEPAFKKQELINMSAKEITRIAGEIINISLSELLLIYPNNLSGGDVNSELQSSRSINLPHGDGVMNNIIKNYENSIYINDEDTQDFLNNNINYNVFINLIDESCPINLRWLKTVFLSLINSPKIMCDNQYLRKLRQENGLKYPIDKVLLVEGITEEILLPAFSKYLGFDFYKEGVQIIPAGGKNQVVKMYYKLIEELKIPIFVLLDKDAEENIAQINPKLRETDKIHLISCGEFEDMLPESLIIKTVNNELNNFATISETDLDKNFSHVKNLENIFKQKGLHEFKKSEFAKAIRDNISEDSDISAEISSIIMEIGL